MLYMWPIHLRPLKIVIFYRDWEAGLHATYFMMEKNYVVKATGPLYFFHLLQKQKNEKVNTFFIPKTPIACLK